MKKLTIVILLILSINVNAQWENMNNGFVGNWGGSVTSLAVKDQKLYAGTWSGGVFVTENDGVSWQKIFLSEDEKAVYEKYGSGWAIYCMVADSTKLYVAADKGFYVSNDEGISWSLCNDGLTKSNILDIVLNNNKIYVATNDGLYVSNKDDIKWTAFSIPITRPWVSSVAVKDSIIIAGSEGIFYSTDLGKTWNRGSDKYKYATITKLFFDSNTLFAGSVNGPAFSKSTDYGLSWESIDYFKASVKAIIKTHNCLIAGCPEFFQKEINISTNDGLEWYSNNHELSAYMIEDIIANNNYLFVGARNGLIRIRISTLLTSVEQQYIPTSFSLSQNYPNPFNPETTIEYSIPKSEHVTLKVYDVLGREVATLVNEFKQAGTYNSKLITQNYKLTSGVYFYRLQAGSYSQTKKLILMK